MLRHHLMTKIDFYWSQKGLGTKIINLKKFRVKKLSLPYFFISQLHSNMLLTLFYDNIICQNWDKTMLFFNFFKIYFFGRISDNLNQTNPFITGLGWFGLAKKILKSKPIKINWFRFYFLPNPNQRDPGTPLIKAVIVFEILKRGPCSP